MNKKIKVARNHLRAAPIPGSYSEESRTIDVVFSTEAPVQRYDWWEGEYYDEILSFSSEAVRMERLTEGAAPVLFNHKMDMQLGTVENARVEEGKGYATLRLTEADDVKDFVQRIREGVLRSISIGYKIYGYEERRENDKLTRTAIDWEPYEISFVTIPADAMAMARSEEQPAHTEAYIKNINIETAARSGTNTNKMEQDNKERDAQGEVKTPISEQPAPVVDEKALRAEAVKAERARISMIEKQLASAKISDAEFRSELINSDVSPEKAAMRILERLEKEQPIQQSSAPSVTGEAEADKRSSLVENAILHRLGYKEKAASGKREAVKLENEARPYRNFSLLELGRDLARQEGLNARSWSKHETADFLLGKNQRAMSTSDFQGILRNVANKRLLEMYEFYPQTWRSLARQMSAPDFKRMYVERLESNIEFDKIVEGGTYKRGKFGETENSLVAETYGQVVSMTRKLIMNDDLGAFDLRLQALAQGAAQTEGNIVWSLILNNTNYNGSALFAAGRNNYLASGSGAPISISSLDAASTAIMTQQNEEGADIMIVPSLLYVAPAQLNLAKQILSSTTDASQANPSVNNPFQGAYEIIPEIRLQRSNFSLTSGNGTEWMLAAGPSAATALVNTSTVGDGGLYTESRLDWSSDALEIKGRFDFGAALGDYRPAFFNAGA